MPAVPLPVKGMSHNPSTEVYTAFIAFTRHTEFNLKLVDKIKSCTNPDQIIRIASSLGFEFSSDDLKNVANNLSSDCFPWAGKGTQWRERFFLESPERNEVNPTNRSVNIGQRRTRLIATRPPGQCACRVCPPETRKKHGCTALYRQQTGV